MSWKYIILRGADHDIPVIFPGELVHSFVAGAMQLAIEAMDPKKDLRPRQLRDMLERGTAPVVGAGFLEGMATAIACGESETLRIKSRDGDTRIINNHPYEHGRETPMGEMTEKILLVKTVEMLMARIDEIDGRSTD